MAADCLQADFDWARTTRIPVEWCGEVVTLSAVAPAGDVDGLLGTALAHPIGAPPLRELVRPGQTVAVLVDDYTRKTPIARLLPPVLAELHQAGVPREQIRIVIALGTHRPMTPAEIAAKLGPAVATQYEVINEPSTHEDAFAFLGHSSHGIPAYVNRFVAEADVRIGLGMITPHLDAGFSGGAKIVLPGVCGVATVDAFHKAGAFIRDNQLGNVDAPLRRALEQFVAEHVPLHFIVNVIPTLDGGVNHCVAGDAIAAHRAGVEQARRVYGVSVRRRYPVVVANCYPYDMDLWQSIKGVWAGDLVTADDGTLIMVTAAPEGNSNYPLVPFYAGQDPDDLRRRIEAGQVEDAKQAATGVMFGNLTRRVRLAIVSGGLTPRDAEMMNAAYFSTVDAAVEAAVLGLAADERRAAVAVLPEAGIVLPIFK